LSFPFTLLVLDIHFLVFVLVILVVTLLPVYTELTALYATANFLECCGINCRR
jgi:hypothetical protein